MNKAKWDEIVTNSHYKWLERHWRDICEEFNIPYEPGIIRAHGDKCYGFMDELKDVLHRNHVAALYLLSYCKPFSDSVRDTRWGWYPVDEWLKRNSYLAKRFPDPNL